MYISLNNRNYSTYLILLSFIALFSSIVFLAGYENIEPSVFANPQVTMKDQMNNIMGMQNHNSSDPNQMQTMREQMNMTWMIGMGPMMMQPMNQTGMIGMGPMMMQPMNQTGMIGMGPMMMQLMNQTGMMGMGPMMSIGQSMAIPCMMIAPVIMGNQTSMGIIPCMINPGLMGTAPMMGMEPMMMQSMNQTGMMGMEPTMIDPNMMEKMMTEHMKDPKHLQMMMELLNKTGMMGK
ncbi:MAG: hypothetical protein ACE5SW_08360 [Nitrososphaeraceae archaeon]